MNRVDFQNMATTRIRESRVLLGASEWSGAYYLAGYAVECGLKACILKYLLTNEATFFTEKRFQSDCWAHRPATLLKLAGLELALTTDVRTNRALQNNWRTVTTWSEESRYAVLTEAEARSMYNAIADYVYGVLQWIKVQW